MDDQARIEWINSASYAQILKIWRHESSESPWVQGEVGKALASRFRDLVGSTPHEIKVAASKSVGW